LVSDLVNGVEHDRTEMNVIRWMCGFMLKERIDGIGTSRLENSHLTSIYMRVSGCVIVDFNTMICMLQIWQMFSEKFT